MYLVTGRVQRQFTSCVHQVYVSPCTHCWFRVQTGSGNTADSWWRHGVVSDAWRSIITHDIDDQLHVYYCRYTDDLFVPLTVRIFHFTFHFIFHFITTFAISQRCRKCSKHYKLDSYCAGFFVADEVLSTVTTNRHVYQRQHRLNNILWHWNPRGSRSVDS